MDLNQVRALAGLPSKPLAIAAPVVAIVEDKLPEAKVIRDEQPEALFEGKKAVVNRIYGEAMSTLGKAAPGLSASAKKAIQDAISDAYEDGHDAGYKEGSEQ